MGREGAAKLIARERQRRANAGRWRRIVKVRLGSFALHAERLLPGGEISVTFLAGESERTVSPLPRADIDGRGGDARYAVSWFLAIIGPLFFFGGLIASVFGSSPTAGIQGLLSILIGVFCMGVASLLFALEHSTATIKWAANRAYESGISDDVQGDQRGIVARAFDSESITLQAPYPSMEKGTGWRPDAGDDWSGFALVRGGCWDSGSCAGVFYLYYGWPGLRSDLVGFRCTKPLASGSRSPVAA